MGVKKYQSRGRTYWQVDDWLSLPDGTVVRFRKRMVPTREQAVALLAKAKADAFEGRNFQRAKPSRFTVQDAWEAYKPVSQKDNRSWQTDLGRGAHLVRHLGGRVAEQLSQRDVDQYRTARLREVTVRGGPPSPATLDHEVALLKRVLSHARRCGDIKHNPVLGIALIRAPNVRRRVVTEAQFTLLLTAAEPALRPILLVAYDQGLRKQEVLQLRWEQVDLEHGSIRLAPQDTKGGEHRVVYMTTRVRSAISGLERSGSPYVFLNPETGRPWVDIRKPFHRAITAAGLEPDTWVHDLRRSFVTNARRRGIAESVVMRMSGHRTRSVFDRYNVVDEGDLQRAAAQMEHGAAAEAGRGFGQETVKVWSGAPQTPRPRPVTPDGA